ncbi:MAG: LOG family protein [Bauldia sp.]
MTNSTKSTFGSRSRVPRPANPERRQAPLPSDRPKPAEEDPQAPRRLQAILASPSYRSADNDPDFLGRYDLRGIRLQLDYLKPELLLEEAGIEHTIVVFGSTRIGEPAAARRAVEEAGAAVAGEAGSEAAKRRLMIAERILAKSRYYEVARAFGRLVGGSNYGIDNHRLVVMTGAGPGIMEAANRGAFDVGAKSVGLNVSLAREQFPNPYVTPELCFRFHYFALRKLHFLLRAKALVAFPGGYGTLDELFELLTLVQTRTIKPMPVVLVGDEFWRGVVDFDALVDEGVIDPEDRDLFWFAETAEEIWDGIVNWYAEAGAPLRPVA